MMFLRFSVLLLLIFSKSAFSEVLFYDGSEDGFHDYIISRNFPLDDVSSDSSPKEIYAAGACYLYGCPEIGENEKDFSKALKYMELSLKLGVSDVYYDFGHMYFNGYFYGGNIGKAIEMFKKGAHDGDVRAQQTLGRIYYGHLGEAYKDYDKSFFWFELAANSGSKYAMSRVSYYYYKGVGVEVDGEKALSWAKKIESTTRTRIRFFPKMLSIYYEKGVGTPVNLVQAVKYYILEGSAGSDDVARLREKMTEEEFQEAVRLANEWQAEHRIRVPRYYQ